MNEKVLTEAREIIAGYFKHIRENNGITVEQLAEMVNVNAVTIVNFEKGRFYPDLKLLLQMCHYLNLSPFFIPKETELFKEFQKKMNYKHFGN